MEGDFINKKTVALTVEQYKEILSVMKEGFCGSRPNSRADFSDYGAIRSKALADGL